MRAPFRNDPALEAENFRRAAPSGVVPRLYETRPDGLVVEEIEGRLPRLPDDLGPLAACLARLHHLPLPPDRAPLPDDTADPWGRARAFVIGQVRAFYDAAVPEAVRRHLRAELATADREAGAAATAPAVGLIAVDCHPGNFVVEPGGRAVLVDLERLQYGAVALDLAHATLGSSTLWDPRIHQLLTPAQITGFHNAWAAAGGDLAAARPWLAPFRRLVMIRTLAWFARFRAEARRGQWEQLPATLREDALARIEIMLRADTLELILATVPVQP